MMEDISVDQDTITLIEAPDLAKENGLDDSSPALIHHVLETNSDSPCSVSASKLPHCLICHDKLSVSGRGAINLFTQGYKTSTQGISVDTAVGNILERDIGKSAHSQIICKKCFKLVNTIDSVEKQLTNLKQEVKQKFRRTLRILKEGTADDTDENFFSTQEDDVEFKIYQNSQTLTGRIKRPRKVKKTKPFVKLEVKEEPEYLNSISLQCQDITDNASYIGDKEVPFKMDDDPIELDGLDISENRTLMQLSNDSESILIQCPDWEDKDAKYKCRFCEERGTFAAIEKHLIQNHLERLFECDVCETQFSSNEELLEHLKEHMSSAETPFKCNFCDAQFALPRQLKEHLRDHGSSTMSCVVCHKRFRSVAALQEHTNTHTGNKPYTCVHCNKGFFGKKLLNAHLKTHKDRPRNHRCHLCTKSFLTHHHLQDHIKTHTSTKDYICDACGKGFTTPRSLELHFVTHSGIKNFHCGICNKAFARKGEVEDHERTHTGEKPFQCEICGATFSQRSNLQSHKKATHYKERNYACDLCHKAFKRRRLLNYHRMSVHTGERPFKCEHCSAAFVYPEHFKKHLRIHTGEKPYKCEICHKAFSSRDNKNAHKFIHSDKKQYECKICGLGFMRKPQLLLHIEQHGITSDPASYIKLNSASLVDLEQKVQPIISMKLEDDVMDQDGLDGMHLASEGVHLVQADDAKYIIQATSDKADENVNQFLASLQGQVVQVREDMGYTTELTQEQLSQVARVAAQVVADHNDTATNFQLSMESPEKEDSTSSHSHTDSLTLNNPVVVRQTQFSTLFPQGAKKAPRSLQSSSPRHIKSWPSSTNDFVDN